MAATVLIARQGEALDGLLHRSAGLGPHALPGVLAANPGLSGTVALAARQRLDHIAPTQHRAPAARPRITAARAVGINTHAGAAAARGTNSHRHVMP